MRQIPLTQGKVALVDDEDYARLAAHKWQAKRSYYSGSTLWYAQRTVQSRIVWMHREILGLTPGDRMETDHRNGDGLDNRRGNLRVATHSQNLANAKPRQGSRSGIRGVYRDKWDKKWRAQIAVDRRCIPLGHFATKEEAAEAYRRAAEHHFGDFAFHRRS